MAVIQSTVRFLAPTGTGDQNIFPDLKGALPTGIELIAGHQTDIGINNDQNKGCVGFADDSLNQRSHSWQAEDAQGTTDTDRRHSDTHCLQIMNTGAQSVDISCRVQAGAFSTPDQVTLNFDNVGSAIYIIATVYANVPIVVGNIATTGEASTGDTINVNGLGITPRLLKFYGVGGNQAYDAANPQIGNCQGFGCLRSDGTLPQGCHTSDDQNNQATVKCVNRTYFYNDSGNALSRCYISQNSSGPINHAFELTGIASGEFTITYRDNAPGNVQRMSYMAFETDEDEVNIIAPSFTAIGSQSFTGVGFKPGHVHFVGGMVQTLGTSETSKPGAGSQSMSYWRGSTSGTGPLGMCWWDKDAAGTSNTKNRNDFDRVIHVRYAADTVGLRADEAGPHSFNADGFTLEMDTVAATVVQVALCFKESDKKPNLRGNFKRGLLGGFQ